MFLVWFFLGCLVGVLAMVPSLIRRRVSLNEREEDILRLEQEKMIVLDFMHTMVEEVGSGMEKEAIYQKVVRAAMNSTGATSACLFGKMEDGNLKGLAVEGLFPPQRKVPEVSSMKMSTRVKFVENVLRFEEIEAGSGFIGTVAESREAKLYTKGGEDQNIVQHSDPALLVQSMMAAPLEFRDNLLGVIAVANPAAGGSFSQTDFSLLKSLAEQSAMAIHNAELIQLQIERNRLDLDLSLASDVQRLLLPKIFPRRDRLEIATHYFSALKVGGDMFDLIDLPGDRLGFAIADVSGKGISASLLMALCQTHLRHLAKAHDCPRDVLRAMNDELIREISQEMFVTMVYGILDVKGGTLYLTRAGHEQPLLVHHANGTKAHHEFLKPSGMALGMVDDETFDAILSTTECEFKRGDVLVLYTDGLTETVDSNDREFGKERLARIVEKHVELEAEQIKDEILRSLDEFAQGGGQPDDLTLMILRLRP